MNTDLFSLLVYAAIVALAVSFLGSARRIVGRAARGAERSRQALGGAAVALLLVIAAGVTHAVAEHTTAARNPMTAGEFLVEHPILVVLSILAVVAGAVAWRRPGGGSGGE